MTASSDVLVDAATHLHGDPSEMEFVMAFYEKTATLLASIGDERTIAYDPSQPTKL
jgi:hypothetical protein